MFHLSISACLPFSGAGRRIGKAFNIPKAEVEAYLWKVVSQGSIVKNELKPIGNLMGYERIYEYNGGRILLAGIGLNGFMVSAYPLKNGKDQ